LAGKLTGRALRCEAGCLPEGLDRICGEAVRQIAERGAGFGVLEGAVLGCLCEPVQELLAGAQGAGDGIVKRLPAAAQVLGQDVRLKFPEHPEPFDLHGEVPAHIVQLRCRIIEVVGSLDWPVGEGLRQAQPLRYAEAGVGGLHGSGLVDQNDDRAGQLLALLVDEHRLSKHGGYQQHQGNTQDADCPAHAGSRHGALHAIECERQLDRHGPRQRYPPEGPGSSQHDHPPQSNGRQHESSETDGAPRRETQQPAPCRDRARGTDHVRAVPHGRCEKDCREQGRRGGGPEQFLR